MLRADRWFIKTASQWYNRTGKQFVLSPKMGHTNPVRESHPHKPEDTNRQMLTEYYPQHNDSKAYKQDNQQIHSNTIT